MNNLVSTQFEQMCRACMVNFDIEGLQSLFDFVDDEHNQRIQIYELLNITVQNLPKIEILDALPKNLCTQCVEKLRAFHEFQNFCIKSDQQLRELIVASLTQVADVSTADPLINDSIETVELFKHDVAEIEMEDLKVPVHEDIESIGNVDRDVSRANCNNVEEGQQDHMEKELNCDKCEATFIYKRNLIRHKNLNHAKTKFAKNSQKAKRKIRKVDANAEDDDNKKCKFQCDVCKKSYLYEKKLKNHLKNVHNIELPEDNKAQSTKNSNETAKENQEVVQDANDEVGNVNSNKQENVEIAKYEIEIDEDFPNSQDKDQADEKNDIERVYLCELCETEFTYKKNLKRHMQRVHDYEWPKHIILENEPNNSIVLKKTKKDNRTWTCEICKTQFLYKRNLHRHMKRTHNEETPIEIKTGIDNIVRQIKNEQKSTSESSEEEWIIPKISIWTCEKCQKKFTHKKNLKRHMINIHNEELPQNQQPVTKTENSEEGSKIEGAVDAAVATPLYKCNECDSVFHKKIYLRKHKYRHKRPGGLKKEKRNCDACGVECKTLQNLREHFMSVHPERLELANGGVEAVETLLKLYICQYCNKNFQQSSTLKDHLRVHTKEQPFLCPHCGKAFNSSSNLRQHILRHESEKKYECPDCPKKFPCLSDLASHKQIHKQLKPHICDICSAAFGKPYQLKIHKMYHNGEKRYQCEYCAMRFVCGDHLRRHIRTHTGEKPYKCKYCPRSFSQSNDMIKHLRTHLGENVYQCELCPAAFRFAADLRKHFAVHKNDDEETKNRNKIARQEAQEQLKMKLDSNAPTVSRKKQLAPEDIRDLQGEGDLFSL